MKPLGLAGMMAEAMKTAEMATAKMAEAKRFAVCELLNMG